MSKKARAKQKEKRLREKRSRKAANRTMYQRWAQEGNNTKSKRGLKRLKKKLVNTVDHKMGPCGNLACNRCHPEYPPFMGALVKTGMAHQMAVKG